MCGWAPPGRPWPSAPGRSDRRGGPHAPPCRRPPRRSGLVTRHCAHVGAIEHDNGPARVRRCGFGRIVSDRRDLRGCLPVVRLKLQGDGMGAGAQALMVCRRDRQQALQNARTTPERGARAQLGLHPLQLRRAPRSQQPADRRDRRSCHGLGQAAAAQLEPRRLDLGRAEQRLRPAHTPVLERLRNSARRTDPVAGRIRHLWPYSMLACSLARSVLVSDSTKPTSASVLTTAGRLNVTSSVVISPALVLASDRTVHCITLAAPWSGISQALQPEMGKQAAPGFCTPMATRCRRCAGPARACRS